MFVEWYLSNALFGICQDTHRAFIFWSNDRISSNTGPCSRVDCETAE